MRTLRVVARCGVTLRGTLLSKVKLLDIVAPEFFSFFRCAGQFFQYFIVYMCMYNIFIYSQARMHCVLKCGLPCVHKLHVQYKHSVHKVCATNAHSLLSKLPQLLHSAWHAF
jgi:ABC-type arginine/histidine transport system permease subunit